VLFVIHYSFDLRFNDVDVAFVLESFCLGLDLGAGVLVLGARVLVKTASTIATYIVHSKLDYCNTLYFSLLNSQINRLQQIQNSLAGTVVKSPRFSHITPVIQTLHWLKFKERIEYKLFSLTYKVLTTYTVSGKKRPRYFQLLL